MSRTVFFFLAAMVIFGYQCSHYEELKKNGRESSHGSSKSHNFGQDCMDCHNDPGNEAVKEGGWFHIAGSVYDQEGSAPFTDSKIELWSLPDRAGTLYYTLEVDALGNFYTEKVVKYNGSCFPVVVNNLTGDFISMDEAFREEGCNGCHGHVEEKIMVE